MTRTKKSSSHSTSSQNTSRIGKAGDRFNTSPYYRGLTDGLQSFSFEALRRRLSPCYQGRLYAEKEVPEMGLLDYLKKDDGPTVGCTSRPMHEKEDNIQVSSEEVCSQKHDNLHMSKKNKDAPHTTLIYEDHIVPTTEGPWTNWTMEFGSSSRPRKKVKSVYGFSNVPVKSPLMRVDSDPELMGTSKLNSLDDQALIPWLTSRSRAILPSVCQPITPNEHSEYIARGKAIVEESNDIRKTRPHVEESWKSSIKILNDMLRLLDALNELNEKKKDISEKNLLLKATDAQLNNIERKLEYEPANEQKNFAIEREKFVVLEKKWEAEKESLVSAVEKFRKHIWGLNHRLKEVSIERQWLIEEGFHHGIKCLHHSEEFLGPLGELHSKLLKSEMHEGLQAGYRLCKKGVPIERAILYRPHAGEDFKSAFLELTSIKFPYLEAISTCVNQSLSVLQSLEPHGYERYKLGLNGTETVGSGTG